MESVDNNSNISFNKSKSDNNISSEKTHEKHSEIGETSNNRKVSEELPQKEEKSKFSLKKFADGIINSSFRKIDERSKRTHTFKDALLYPESYTQHKICKFIQSIWVRIEPMRPEKSKSTKDVKEEPQEVVDSNRKTPDELKDDFYKAVNSRREEFEIAQKNRTYKALQDEIFELNEKLEKMEVDPNSKPKDIAILKEAINQRDYALKKRLKDENAYQTETKNTQVSFSGKDEIYFFNSKEKPQVEANEGKTPTLVDTNFEEKTHPKRVKKNKSIKEVEKGNYDQLVDAFQEKLLDIRIRFKPAEFIANKLNDLIQNQEIKNKEDLSAALLESAEKYLENFFQTEKKIPRSEFLSHLNNLARTPKNNKHISDFYDKTWKDGEQRVIIIKGDQTQGALEKVKQLLEDPEIVEVLDQFLADKNSK